MTDHQQIEQHSLVKCVQVLQYFSKRVASTLVVFSHGELVKHTMLLAAGPAREF